MGHQRSDDEQGAPGAPENTIKQVPGRDDQGRADEERPDGFPRIAKKRDKACFA